VSASRQLRLAAPGREIKASDWDLVEAAVPVDRGPGAPNQFARDRTLGPSSEAVSHMAGSVMGS
jgi:hypothetical protein